MSKKRILMVTEASHTFSGYGKYTREVLHRLHKTGKYELAEQAAYGRIGEAGDRHVKWAYYPNAVASNDSRWKTYQASSANQFGAWRFERILSDFKPDIVFDIRDYWMLSFEDKSPLREFYHWAIMPTVDSAPQKPEWIDTFIRADGVFAYSEWGADVLDKQSNGAINLQGTASPGVDLEIFKPMNQGTRKLHRINMGVDPNVFIVGMVGRNQKRKLYPELFEAFRHFLDTADPEIADKTYLYVHTSYPDRGWDIPALLNKFNLGSKVLFTYICTQTRKPFVSFFQDGVTYSPYSKKATGVFPSVKNAISEEDLAAVYNLMDIYVQYAICEGFGMPMVEACACGNPLMAVNYSAMESVVKNLKGMPIPVSKMFHEMETDAMRAYPDNEHLARAIENYLKKPEAERERIRERTRKLTEKRYNWDNTAKAWEDYFDSVTLTGNQGNWNMPHRKWPVPTQMPNNIFKADLIDYICDNVLHEPHRKYTWEFSRAIRDLSMGFIMNGGKITNINEEQVWKSLMQMAKHKQHCEDIRCGVGVKGTPDFIQYAHSKRRAAQ